MSAERWQRAEVLFEQACERCPEDRVSFLDQACRSDPELRRLVEGLLAADQRAAGFLARPALEESVRPAGRSATDPGLPVSIGPYRLVRELGAGGMGQVWLAVRADGQFERRVAIKLLPRVMATDDQRRRLHLERQILAGLDHPHIARLLDAGCTPDQVAYVVLEYIDGEPIVEFCDRHRLTISERLELFRAVCSAVHFAHQNLVVHRDIKPSNILVTEEGVPKLLDFGIAKLLNPELTSKSLVQTAPWQRLLTPNYASPEQILGKALTTATDVYSLGVVLHELLTGRLPHRLNGLAPAEIERTLAEEEPLRPSLRVAPGAPGRAPDGDEPARMAEIADARRTQPRPLQRRLAGDLDTIVGKALRKEPQRRYSSAEQLSEDLRRHLAGLPVIARRPTLRYRAGRALRRHRLAVGIGSAFVTLLVASAIGLGALSLRLAHQRDEIRAERDRGRLYGQVLDEVLRVADPQQAPGYRLTLADLLDQGTSRILPLLADQPEIDAQVRSTIGTLYRRLGQFAASETLLESALERRRDRFGEHHPAVAASLADLGMLRADLGDYAGAEALIRRALEIRRALYGEEDLEVAASQRQLGEVLADRGLYDEAERLLRQALTTRRAVLGEHHQDVADSRHQLALLLWRRGEYEAAEAEQRRALSLYRELYGSEHLTVADALQGLGRLAQARGDFDASERYLEESMTLTRKLVGDRHWRIVVLLGNLGSLAAFQGDYATAEVRYGEALTLGRQVFGEDHPALQTLLLGVGVSRSQRGDPEGAEPLLRQALEIRRKVYPPGHYLTARTEVYLGVCLTRLGRFDEAEELLLSGHRVMRAQQPRRAEEVRQVLDRLVQLYQAWGKPEEAAGYDRLRERPAPPRAAEPAEPR